MKVLQQTITVSSGGGSPRIDPANLPVPEVVYLYPDGGSPISLAGNFDIQFSSYPDEGNETIFVWFGGDFDLNGNTMLIQSQNITQEMLNSNGCFSARTMASGEQMYQYVPDFNTTGALSGEAILINSLPLNRLTGMTEGQMIMADSANVPKAVNLSGDVAVSNYTGVMTIQPAVVTNAKLADMAAARFKVGNSSNRPADVEMTGDVTMDNTGATTIADGVITANKLAFDVGIVAVAQLTLSSAQILALNATPQTIIPAPGVGLSIVVLKAIVTQTFVTTAYTTNLNLYILTDTATVPQAANSCMAFTTSRTISLDIGSNVFAVGETQIIENKALKATIETGNPAAGDGTMTITIFYTTI